tara:strand:- start:2124 stop:4079 length:1956 start_codon:yes stop_codon:yes gene_type:complete
MPFTKFTNLDFDQIKTSIKDYLRANSDFTDFDFEGSNFSVLIDTLAYNTYITAFNSNMIVNESFLESATLRQNVVSLARNIGYVPRSKTAATADISFTVTFPDFTAEMLNRVPNATLSAGLICVGDANNTSFVFSTSENWSSPIKNVNGSYSAEFSNILVKQGTLVTKEFTKEASLDQKFVLENPGIDTSTIKVYIDDTTNQDDGLGIEYFLVDNIINVDSSSEIYLLQEVQDEKYELIFGDGIIGKKIANGAKITVKYITTDGKEGNGVGKNDSFSFAGKILEKNPEIISNSPLLSFTAPSIVTNITSQNGSDIEDVDSIKYFAPKIYSSQFRAVTSRDYETIVKRIYPDTESVAVIGGEELDPPEFGTVSISIKPKNGTFVSDFNKSRILSQLKQYSISGINQKITDLKVLYVEIDSSVYYNSTKVSSENSLKSSVLNALTSYANSLEVNKFGGRFKYSKVLQVIDKTNVAISSNITKVRIRRDLKVAFNQFAQYELCYGNQFHVNSAGYNIKSKGFYISGQTKPVYITDVPDQGLKTGVISLVQVLDTGEINVIAKAAGTVDYIKGEIMLATVNITSTLDGSDVVEIQAIPESNDVVGLRDLYLNFSISESTINMVRDVISSGDEITGTSFIRDFYTSSYLNGKLIRE